MLCVVFSSCAALVFTTYCPFKISLLKYPHNSLYIRPFSPFKNAVYFFYIPPLTPDWPEKWVLSACGAESAVCNMREHKLSSPPRSLPRGGQGGGRNAGIWGGGPRGGEVGRVLFLPYKRNLQQYSNLPNTICPLPEFS
jgi:hypothetical protein